MTEESERSIAVDSYQKNKWDEEDEWDERGEWDEWDEIPDYEDIINIIETSLPGVLSECGTKHHCDNFSSMNLVSEYYASVSQSPIDVYCEERGWWCIRASALLGKECRGKLSADKSFFRCQNRGEAELVARYLNITFGKHAQIWQDGETCGFMTERPSPLELIANRFKEKYAEDAPIRDAEDREIAGRMREDERARDAEWESEKRLMR